MSEPIQSAFCFGPGEKLDEDLSQQELKVPDAKLLLVEHFLAGDEATTLFECLLTTIEWMQDYLKLFDSEIKLPRLTAWHGDPGTIYTYSRVHNQPRAWTPELDRLRSQLEKFLSCRFNSVLLNLYRSGEDSVSWHQDNERELGELPIIASVSLGASRRFQLKHCLRPEVKRVDLQLKHGSLLVMSGETQRFWKHRVPKERTIQKPRINLTFRFIHRRA